MRSDRCDARFRPGSAPSPRATLPHRAARPRPVLVAQRLLARFATLWRAHEERAAKRALGALVVTSVLASAHLARLGTPLARIATFAIWLVAAGFATWTLIRAYRAYLSARGIIEKTLVPTDADLGERALRALRLVERSEREPETGSPELANLHFARLIGRIPEERVEERAALSARRWQGLGIVLGVVALGSVLPGPFRVVEGVDVLFARHGEAPLAFDWLDDVLIVAKPPAYVHESDTVTAHFSRLTLPQGTTITLRGRPVHDGRKLVLVGGTQEVPFVSDASGLLVARFTLGESTRLRIAARFGEVLIPQADSLEVISIPDETPEVSIEGAPRTARLLDEPEITVAYEARDDHGLRDVHLVLRAGPREDRRVLAELDGDTRAHRGAIRLGARDPFFKRTYVPVEVTVEARDNDPITGPKWGKSQAITLLPPAVGEPEAMRYAALLRARDALVDLTAFRIEAEIGTDAASKREHVKEEASRAERALVDIEGALEGSYGGLVIPRRTALLARGQLRKLRDALEAEARKTNQATHDALRTVTENATLGLDAALRSLGARDAATVSRRLADVADDCAAGAELARNGADRARGTTRMEAAVSVLSSGGEQLVTLGSLGADLGEIVENGLRRIRRPWKEDDFFHAELAARDLAARLRNPVPSFSGGSGGGVESGTGGEGSGGSPGDGSDSEGEIARQERELEDLARDHANELAEVERALREGSDPEQLEKLSEEARKRAEEVRQAARSLRSMSGEPGTAESAAGAGREHAEAMAGGLERGSLSDAVSSGRNALRALDEAQKKPSAFSPFDDARVHEQAKQARDRIAEQLAWAEDALENLRKSASANAADKLRESASREGKLADRAGQIADQAKRSGAELPDEVQEMLEKAESAMREAQRALGSAKGEQAIERQRTAQRLLEQAQSEGQEGEEGRDSSREGARVDGRGERDANDADFDAKLPIPAANQHKGPEAFRKRVLEGLGSSNDPRLRDAVKRYAEGLLK